jgi:hypothetical protein
MYTKGEFSEFFFHEYFQRVSESERARARARARGMEEKKKEVDTWTTVYDGTCVVRGGKGGGVGGRMESGDEEHLSAGYRAPLTWF